MSGRALLETVGDAVRTVRTLRYENPESFDDVTPEELETVIRGLRAVAYSCSEGARHLERILRIRRAPATPEPAPTERVADLMAALESSVAAARSAREHDS